MDIATHSLASLALSRAIFPRAPRLLWFWIIAAGIIADVDAFSAALGPSAYLAAYHTYTHSILASFIFAGLITLLYRMSSGSELRQSLPSSSVFIAAIFSAWLHLLMDAVQWQGETLFWPASNRRIAFDLLPSVDPWVISVLIAVIALPELLHLVSSEIGAKEKKPHGRVPAILGFVLILLYVAARAELHSSAIAQLQNRVYSGEPARRVAAFPEFASLVSWRGVVETESAVHQPTVHLGLARSVAEAGISLFKPEPSPLLDAAQVTDSAKRFLRAARFPKASIQKVDSGSEVIIRDVRYAAVDESQREPAAIIEFDATGKLLSQEIVWATRATPR